MGIAMRKKKTTPRTSESEESLFLEKSHINPQFAVGLQFSLEIKQKAQRLRTSANLIGWYRPHFLITTVPVTDRRTIIIQPGTEIITRYLFEGTVYGFLTHLAKKYQEPRPFWILDYPEVIEKINLRDSTRVQTFLHVKTSDEKQWMILDLSNSGALIRVEGEPTIGEETKLNFTLPNGEEIKELPVEIVRLSSSAEDHTIGVRFKEDKDQVEKIRQFILSMEQFSKGSQTEFEIEEDR